MKLELNQMVEFVVGVNKQFVAGSRWKVFMASDGPGRNALLVRMGKSGWALSESNLKNVSSLTEGEVLKLVRVGAINIS